jgi:hypothetical protein
MLVMRVLYNVEPLLSNDSVMTPIGNRFLTRANGLITKLFSARSAQMAAHATMDTETEGRCFLCGLCLDVISRTVSE